MADQDPKNERSINSALETRKKILENISRLDKEKAAVYRNSLNAVKDINKEEEYLNTLLAQTQDALDSVGASLDYVYQSFKDSVNEMKKGAEYTNLQKSALSKLSDIARNSLNIRQGETVLEENKFKQLQDQAHQRKQDLELALKNGKLKEEEKEVLRAQIKDAKELQNAMKKVLETDEGILKSLGFIPKVAEGIDKALSKLGLPDLGFKDALDKTRMLGQEAAHSGKSFNAVSQYTKLIIGNIKEAASFANLLTLGIGAAVVALIAADKHTGELAKNMGVSYKEATEFHHEMTDMANTSDYLVVTTNDLINAQMKLSDVIGTANNLSKDLLDDFAGLTEQAGYSEEAMLGLGKVVSATGADLSTTTAEMLGQVELLNQQNNLSVNSKQLVEEISKVSADTVLLYGAQGDKLAKAAFEAKQMGINLEQAKNIAQNLLNFEDSISAELEAELLTGKDINLEKARQLALSGDIAGAAKAALENVKSSAEFTSMNVIQQEALAKAAGVTREDLAKSLMEREALARLGKQEGDIQKEYNALVAKGLSQEEIAIKLGDKKLTSQLQSTAASEKFSATFDKLKEVFTSLVSPLLPILQVIGDIATALTPVFKMIGQIVKFTIEWGKYLLIPLGLIKAFGLVSKGILATQKAYLAFKSVEVGREKSINALKAVGNFLTGNLFKKETAIQAKRIANLATRQGEVNLEKMSILAQNQSLAVQTRLLGIKMRSWAGNAKDFIVEKGKAAWKGIQIGYETTLNAIKRVGAAITKGELIANIGKAAMGVISSLSSIPIVGWALGLAAAGTAIALGYKFMKGDDVMSQGYGKRTLLAGKDAIALNDNDTVIAGTDLGGKKRNQPEPAGSSFDISPLVERMSAVEGVLTQILQKETNIYLDSTKVGTGFAVASSKVQ